MSGSYDLHKHLQPELKISDPWYLLKNDQKMRPRGALPWAKGRPIRRTLHGHITENVSISFSETTLCSIANLSAP